MPPQRPEIHDRSLTVRLINGAFSGLKFGLYYSVLFVIGVAINRKPKNLVVGRIEKDWAKPLTGKGCLRYLAVCLLLIGVTVGGCFAGYRAWPTVWGATIGGICVYALAWMFGGAIHAALNDPNSRDS